ncbi:MAG: hypothetical protein ACRENP_08135 [Longimicrobiales bacterium]
MGIYRRLEPDELPDQQATYQLPSSGSGAVAADIVNKAKSAAKKKTAEVLTNERLWYPVDLGTIIEWELVNPFTGKTFFRVGPQRGPGGATAG